MSRDREQKREEKKAKEKARRERVAKQRLKEKVSSLLDASDQELLDIIPRTKVETILGEAVRWQVLRTREEVRAINLRGYNISVYADLHYRLRSLPLDHNHPLGRVDRAFKDNAPDFAERVKASHNQVVILGNVGRDECVKLHLAGIYPTTIFIEDIVLANPKVPAVDLMEGQEFAGMGHGVFVEILNRLKDFGCRRNFTAIRAHAMDNLRASIFQRKGFQLDRSTHNSWNEATMADRFRW